jgi:3-hydroxyisobutyrate dehydrogenase
MGMQRIGFVGLGVMGSGMAGRLMDAGFEVAVYNRTKEKTAELAGRGARVGATPADVAVGADVLLISVATEDAVREVLFGENGALAVAQPGTVVADMSTVSPDAAQELAGLIVEAGHRPLDARVLGNGQHAKDGELRFMIGGEAADVELVRPVLEVLAKEIVHLGGHGTGATAKVALNLLMGVQLQALSEAVIFGERAGLDRNQLIGLIAASGYSSPMMKFKSGVMARRAFERADFRLSLMRKDLLLAIADAQRMGVPMPATTASYEVLTSAVNAGLGELDCAAVLSEVERMSGTTPPPPAKGGPGGPGRPA